MTDDQVIELLSFSGQSRSMQRIVSLRFDIQCFSVSRFSVDNVPYGCKGSLSVRSRPIFHPRDGATPWAGIVGVRQIETLSAHRVQPGVLFLSADAGVAQPMCGVKPPRLGPG